MSRVYVYVVDRDFGFAPNPFHGYCSLATCKPIIRKKAEVEDWIVGMGGARLKATGRCIFAMRVTQKITFNDYWLDPLFIDKKPVRNGSKKMMVGDNIYYRDPESDEWYQADSHHSNVDGTINLDNLSTDTGSTENVLISDDFFYFGNEAPVVPANLLSSIGYKNSRGYRVFEINAAADLITWLKNNYGASTTRIMGDPFDFNISERRYSGRGSKIT